MLPGAAAAAGSRRGLRRPGRSVKRPPLEPKYPVGRAQQPRVMGDHERAAAADQRAKRFHRRSAASASSPAVGSSSTTTGVSRSSVRAISMRRRWPPESAPAALADACLVALRQCRDELVRPRGARGRLDFGRRSHRGGRRRCCRARSRRRAASPGAGWPRCRAPTRALARGGRSRRGDVTRRGSAKRSSSRASVDLPPPLGPVSATTSPGASASESPLSTGSGAPG